MTSHNTLTDLEVEEIRELADRERKKNGIIDSPIASSMPLLLESEGIAICQYPFGGSTPNLDAFIVSYGREFANLTFIGLNTSLYYDEQLFALAHEYYHYLANTNLENTDEHEEAKADRFAEELLLPCRSLNSLVLKHFGSVRLKNESPLRILRFVAGIHCQWHIPFKSIVSRLSEEGYISVLQTKTLLKTNPRDEKDIYYRILNGMSPDTCKILNTATKKTEISPWVLEVLIKNFEDGFIIYEDFSSAMNMYGKAPEDFGFSEEVDKKDIEELDRLQEDSSAD